MKSQPHTDSIPGLVPLLQALRSAGMSKSAFYRERARIPYTQKGGRIYTTVDALRRFKRKRGAA